MASSKCTGKEWQVKQDMARVRLIGEVKSAISSTLPEAIFVEVESQVSSEGATVQAVDPADERGSRILLEHLSAEIGSLGWTTTDSKEEGQALSFHASKPNMGEGSFVVQTAAIAFHGIIDRS